jgi:hypothetical protein
MEECVKWRAVATAVWHVAVLIPSVRASPARLFARLAVVRIVPGDPEGFPNKRMHRATHDARESEALGLLKPGSRRTRLGCGRFDPSGGAALAQ